VSAQTPRNAANREARQLAQDYFKHFWLITTDGRKLYPALVRDRATGVVAYRSLAKGSNKKADGREYTDPIEANRAFMGGASLHFGAPGEPDNRFDLDGPKTARVDATVAFRAANPGLKF